MSIITINLLLYFLGFHAIHVSQAECEYNQDSKTFQLAVHVFADDVELYYENKGYGDLQLATEFEKENGEALMSSYILDHLNVVNGRDTLEFRYLGREITEDYFGVWHYFETNTIDLAEEITFENTILLSEFRDQKNLTSCKWGNQKKLFYIFNSNKKRHIFELK